MKQLLVKQDKMKQLLVKQDKMKQDKLNQAHALPFRAKLDTMKQDKLNTSWDEECFSLTNNTH